MCVCVCFSDGFGSSPEAEALSALPREILLRAQQTEVPKLSNPFLSPSLTIQNQMNMCSKHPEFRIIPIFCFESTEFLGAFSCFSPPSQIGGQRFLFCAFWSASKEMAAEPGLVLQAGWQDFLFGCILL